MEIIQYPEPGLKSAMARQDRQSRREAESSESGYFPNRGARDKRYIPLQSQKGVRLGREGAYPEPELKTFMARRDRLYFYES
jgi:hypothetical protein